MNKTKKLMLAIFSLIAIVSCGEAGKSGDSESGASAKPLLLQIQKVQVIQHKDLVFQIFQNLI